MSGQFELALAKFAERTGDRIDEVVIRSLLSLQSNIVEPWPVDTGFSRANWQMTVDEPASTTVVGAAPPLSFPVPAAGHVYYLVNPVRYAMRLEFGFTGTDSLGRHYNQPPRGVVARAVLMWDEIVGEAAASIGQ